MRDREPLREVLRHRAGAPLGSAAVVVVAAATTIGLRPEWSGLLLRPALDLVAAALVWLGLRLVVRAYPPPLHPAPPAAEPGALPGQLQRLARSAALAQSSWADAWIRFRPLLRPVVEDRLRRRQIDLDGEPGRPRTVLGDALYEIVGPNRFPPPGGGERVPMARLRSLVEVVERLATDADR